MTNPNTLATTHALLAFCRPSDDHEAAAAEAADLEDARLCAAAEALGTADLFVTAGILLAGAAKALQASRLPWDLLDGAERAVQDLRLEHGCEEWPVSDWTEAQSCVAMLHDEVQKLRTRARQMRDEAADLMATRLAKRAG
jgi:hypothetical protein